jgi:hypothetical protein
MTALRIQIQSVSGCGNRFDPVELGQRVGAELESLLARQPLPNPPVPGTTIRAPGGRVHVASNGTAASVAHAVARQLYLALASAQPCR